MFAVVSMNGGSSVTVGTAATTGGMRPEPIDHVGIATSVLGQAHDPESPRRISPAEAAPLFPCAEPTSMVAPSKEDVSAQPAGQPSNPAVLAHQEHPTGSVPANAIPVKSSEEQDEERDDDDGEFTGPVDAERCAVSGPGFSGGTAGQPARLRLVAMDASGRRIEEGGAYVRVAVQQSGAIAQHTTKALRGVDAEVVDHGNGCYEATYTISERGMYEVSVEVNGRPVGGSPFHVFFSAPIVSAGAAAACVADADGGALKKTNGSGVEAKVEPAGYYDSLGAQAAKAGVLAPLSGYDQGRLRRIALIGGLSPFATHDTLRAIFMLCGTVLGVHVSAAASHVATGFALVEFAEESAAKTAVARLHGAAMMGGTLQVESAAKAIAAAAAQPGPPPTGGDVGGGINSLSHTNAAAPSTSGVEAAAALARRLASGASGDAKHHERDTQSHDRVRKRASVVDRRRRRSRSRSRSRSRDRGEKRRRRDHNDSDGGRRREREREGAAAGKHRHQRRSRSEENREKSRERSQHRNRRRKDREHGRSTRRSRSRTREDKGVKKGDGVTAEAAVSLGQQQPEDDLEALLNELGE